MSPSTTVAPGPSNGVRPKWYGVAGVSAAKAARDGVVAGQHHDVVRALIAQQVALQVDVGVPVELIEVVGRDVEDGREMGAAVRARQLRVADLQHYGAVVGDAIERAEQPTPNVAAHEDRPRRGLEHRAHQRRDRGLAGAAGDPDGRDRTALQEESHHGRDRRPGRPGRGQEREVVGHALADEQHVYPLGQAGVVCARLDRDGDAVERTDLLTQRVDRLAFGDDDLRRPFPRAGSGQCPGPQCPAPRRRPAIPGSAGAPQGPGRPRLGRWCRGRVGS